MKICIITNTYSLDLIGGSNVYVVNLAKELVNRNNEVVVISSSPIKKDTIEIDGSIKIYRFHPLNFSNFYSIGRESIVRQGIWTFFDIYSYYSYKKIIEILKKENPDVVHIHIPIDVTLSAFAAVKKLGLPLLLTVHDYLLLCRRIVLLHGSGHICTNININPLCRIYRMFSKKIVNANTDIVIFPSKFIKDIYEHNGFFENSKKFILPYGLALQNDISTGSSLKNNDRINFLYVGSLTKHKGIEILINAFKNIENKNISLSIIGEGILEKRLENLSRDDQRIIFYGKVCNRDIEKFYNKFHILILPSIWNEVLGIVIQEAFRAGIPVIGSNIGGIPELVRDSFNGFLFEPGNITELKQYLEFFIDRPEKIKEFGENAKDFVKRFRMSDHIEKITTFYTEAINLNKNPN